MSVSYDFNTPVNRWDTDSLKWDVSDNELPMWVADMDFAAAPEIRQALHDRVDQMVFGYNIVPYRLFEAYQSWWQRRHDFSMNPMWMMYCTGVVPAISSIVRKVTTVGENVLIQAPVYNIFYNSILNNGRHVLSSDLRYENGEYHIDFADLEAKMANPQTSLMILCNPHNPVGKIWDRQTLNLIGLLAAKHHVIVLSDEIHCDLTRPGTEYIPFASVSETNRRNSITCIAPTKCFNLAGLQTACIVVPDPVLRHRVERGINTDEVAEPNSFAVTAAVTAFEKGEAWLEELRSVLFANRDRAEAFIGDNLPELKVVRGDATYLLWVDCSAICADTELLTRTIRRETGLYITQGSGYGETGKTFVRINLACPPSVLEDGLSRLKKGVQAWIDR